MSNHHKSLENGARRQRSSRHIITACRGMAGRSMAGLMLTLACSVMARGESPDAVLNFSRDIRPILSDKCFQCHGPDESKREGGLRLDVRASAIEKADSGKVAIQPKDAANSELVKRIFSESADHQMPPAESKKTLSLDEKKRLQQWIEQGATYEGHWAFQPPQSKEPPELSNEDKQRWPAWNANPIDRFLLTRMRAEKLTPNPPADKATLLRRVALDLTGLPPTIEQQSRYFHDPSPNAYEAMVDRMLASPQYGERMANQWLDFARYADSNGYQSDGSRDVWGWRDWVIHAYNDNKPFDQFTIEQLAGDMLPGATDSQIIATGFNRNHRLNGEGGRIEAEWFVETVIDRVETTGLTWLGLTLNCCRCHDHKYDPISQKEFYQLFAYFNSVEESGVLAPAGKNGENTPPLFTMKSAAHEAEIARREEAIAKLQKQIDEELIHLPELAMKWAEETRRTSADAKSEKSEKADKNEKVESPWKRLPLRSASSEGGATLEPQSDGSYLAKGKNPPNDIYRVTIDVPKEPVTGLLLEVLPDPNLPNQSLGRGSNGNFTLTDLELTWSSKPNEPFELDRTQADYSQKQWPAKNLASNKGIASGSKNRKGWAVDGNDPEKRLPRKLMIVLKKPATKPDGDHLVIRFGNSSTFADHNVGRFRWSISSTNRSGLKLDAPPEDDAIAKALEQSSDKWDEATRKLVENHYRTQVDNPVRKLESELEQKKKDLASYKEDIPTTMVMKEGKPRDAFVLVRGEYDKPSDKVQRRTPAVLPPLPEGASNDRLGLAKWIVSPDNPLTARVWVNREWERFFGIGIVKTSENMGSQAEYPVHPELLDWLAIEFMTARSLPKVSGTAAHRWDMKALQKLILTSQAYQQSSRVDESKRQSDPDNRFVSRGPRFRLSGEVVRDSALAASGLLVQRLGGPSVRPYMPAGVWDETSKYGNLRNYQHDKDDGRYRRSLYTIWKRTAAPPTMLLFDAPNREVCTVKRSRTNTPLQALSLLNEVTFVEAARALATEMMTHKSTPADRLEFGYQRVLGRLPTDSERQVLLDGLDNDLRTFKDKPERAEQLVRFGELKAPATIAPEELAAYTLLANVLFNLDEFITRE